MTPQEIENLSSLQQLLQLQQQGLYIDVYSGPVKLKVQNSWVDLNQLTFIKALSDSTQFVSGYNFEIAINQGLYFYVFPGRGKGNMLIDQHRSQLDSNSYSGKSISYSSYYGVCAINGQSDYIRIQVSKDLILDPDPGSNCLNLSIQRRQNL